MTALRGSIASLMTFTAIVAVDCGLARMLWVEIRGPDSGDESLIYGLLGSLPMLNALAAAEILRRRGRISARSAVGFLVVGCAAMLSYDTLAVLAPDALERFIRPLKPLFLGSSNDSWYMVWNLSVVAAYLAAPQFLLATLAGWFHRRYRLRVGIERRDSIVVADCPPTGVREGMEFPVRG